MFASDRASWQNPKVLTTLLLVFLTGAFAGALSMRLGLHEKLHRSAPAWREGNKEIFLSKFKRELNLTPEQTEKMSTILDDYKMYYQSLQDQLEEVRSTGKARIMAVLDDQQKGQVRAVALRITAAGQAGQVECCLPSFSLHRA